MNAEESFGHILVVEDDRDIRDSIVEVLAEAGYTIAVANDGAEALRQLRSGARKPDLILLDLMMPNMNGSEFRHEQRRHSDHASIPVAVITADVNAKTTAAALGAAGFLRKPLKIQPLLDLVEGILGGAPAPRGLADG